VLVLIHDRDRTESDSRRPRRSLGAVPILAHATLELWTYQGLGLQGEVVMRPVRAIAALVSATTIGMLTLLTAPAWAASTTAPVVVHASPSPVVAGHTVTLSGSVGADAAASDCNSISLYSIAFGPTNDDPAYTAAYATAKPTGSFTTTARIPHSKPSGTYAIYLRCGGSPLGGGTLVVRAAPTTPPARIDVSPSSVAAGRTVTLSGSVGPAPAGSDCARGVTLISRAFVHTNDFAGLPAVGAAVKSDGTFTASTTIPRSKPAGTYTITGRCGGANLGAAAKLVVQAAPTPTTTPAPAAPTATGPPIDQPQVPAPTVAGPPAQPAATAAAQPASRWIIPWLAALGSGTLAALGVWLLYRRRHPAGPSRQGRSRMAH
jgi:hypothetical protein